MSVLGVAAIGVRRKVGCCKGFSCAEGDGRVGNAVLVEQLAETSAEGATVDDERFVLCGGEQVIDGGFHSTSAGGCIVDDAPAFLQMEMATQSAYALLH